MTPGLLATMFVLFFCQKDTERKRRTENSLAEWNISAYQEEIKLLPPSKLHIQLCVESLAVNYDCSRCEECLVTCSVFGFVVQKKKKKIKKVACRGALEVCE